MNMTIIRRLSLLLAVLLAVAGMTACNLIGSEEETELDLNSLPRYDYLGEDILPLVSLDPSIYAAMQLTVSSQYEITDELVEEYIQGVRLENRVPVGAETETESESETVVDGSLVEDAETVTETAASAADDETESETVVKMTDKPMEKGDSAFIYYRGEIDGEEFSGGSNWSSNVPHELVLGSGSFISGFEDGLIGIIPGDTSRDNPVAVKATFPEDYGSAELNGKEATFYVFVEYAVEYTIPELDRDFIVNTLEYTPEKEDYADEAELIAEYRGYVREKLEADVADSLQSAKVEAMWRYLISQATIADHPEEEMAYYTAYYKDIIQSNYEYYMGVGGESFTNLYPTVDTFAVVYMGLETGANWLDEVAKLAQDVVERDMIIHAIGEQEGIETVSEEEFDAEVQYYIDYYKQNGNITKTREQIIEELGGENAIRLIAFKIKMEEWLMKKTTFTFAD